MIITCILYQLNSFIDRTALERNQTYRHLRQKKKKKKLYSIVC